MADDKKDKKVLTEAEMEALEKRDNPVSETSGAPEDTPAQMETNEKVVEISVEKPKEEKKSRRDVMKSILSGEIFRRGLKK